MMVTHHNLHHSDQAPPFTMNGNTVKATYAPLIVNESDFNNGTSHVIIIWFIVLKLSQI